MRGGPPGGLLMGSISFSWETPRRVAQAGGSGLGLAIARPVVLNHGGEIPDLGLRGVHPG